MSFTLGIIIILTSNAILFNIPASQGRHIQGYNVKRLSEVLTPLEQMTYMTFGTLPSRVGYSTPNHAYVVRGQNDNFRNDMAERRKYDQRKYKMMPRWEYILRQMVPNIGLPFGYLADLIKKSPNISPLLLSLLGQGNGEDKNDDDLDEGTDDEGNGTDDDGNGTDDEGNGTDDEGNGTDDKGNGTDNKGNEADDEGNGTDDKGNGTDDKVDDTNDIRDGGDGDGDGGNGKSEPKNNNGGYKFPSFPNMPSMPSKLPSMPSKFPSIPSIPSKFTSMPSKFPSMPSIPSKFPSMPSKFPSMSSLPSKFPSMPTMPSIPPLWNKGDNNGDGTGTDYKQKMKDIMQSDLTKSLAKGGIGMLPGGNAALTAFDLGSKFMNKGTDEVVNDAVEDAVSSDTGQAAIKGFIGFLPGGDKVVKAMEAGSKVEGAAKKIPGI